MPAQIHNSKLCYGHSGTPREKLPQKLLFFHFSSFVFFSEILSLFHTGKPDLIFASNFSGSLVLKPTI